MSLIKLKMSADIVHIMMTLRDQVKIYHWQTLSYSRHIATNDLLPKLDINIDQFIEVYIGKYGRPTFRGKSASIILENFDDKHAPKFIKDAIEWLSTKLSKSLKKTDTDLLNIRDTILADLNQVLYLFTLN
jgi:hypothetical protein